MIFFPPKNNFQVNVDEIANEIINTGKTCYQHGVDKVLYQALFVPITIESRC